MKKTFKLKISGKMIISIQIEGDDDLVESFVSEALVGSFGVFNKSHEPISKKIASEVIGDK